MPAKATQDNLEVKQQAPHFRMRGLLLSFNRSTWPPCDEQLEPESMKTLAYFYPVFAYPFKNS
jgi:hypothetical protein